MRSTANDVKQVISTTMADPQIQSLGSVACAYMDQVFSGDVTLSEELLRHIETYITAHLISIHSPEEGLMKTHEVGETKIELTLNPGTGLGASRFGQQAMLLDLTGKLKAAQTTMAEFKVI